jgi:hypothetical protein
MGVSKNMSFIKTDAEGKIKQLTEEQIRKKHEKRLEMEPRDILIY